MSKENTQYDNQGFSNDESVKKYSQPLDPGFAGFEPYQKSPEKSNKIKVILAVLVVLILAVGLAVGIYFAVNHPRNDKDKDHELHKGKKYKHPVKPSEKYPYHEQLDENYFLYWKFTDTHITFETHTKTKGWVGFGLSTSGNMRNADVVIGWVKDGKAFFHDRYSSSESQPKIDESQDWELLFGKEQEGYTILKFVRPIDTCDTDKDIVVPLGTARIIYSYQDNDPIDRDSVRGHSYDHRGTRSMLLLDPPAFDQDEPEMGDDIRYIDFLNNKYQVPDYKDTTYFCKIIDVPKLDQKHHVIKFEPIIEKGNEDLVHHIVIRYCTFNVDLTKITREYDCLTDVPQEIYFCFNMYLAWAIGGRTVSFPEEAGMPIGTSDSPKFIIMETHYDNPGLKKGLVDSSGIRLTTTTKLRKYDAAMLQAGSNVTPFVPNLTIPPKSPTFHHTGYCSKECLSQGMEGEPIHIFSVGLHTHLLGAAIRQRVVRGDTELEMMAFDNTYDFDFQEFRQLHPMYTLQPGDRLILDCIYDSRDRVNSTYGGFGTQQEMCLTFNMYYPKMKKLDLCLSELQYDTIDGYENLQSYMDDTDWSIEAKRNSFEELTQSIKFKQLCFGDMSLRNSGDEKILSQEDQRPVTPLPEKTSSVCDDK